MKKFLSVLMAATMLVGVMALTGCGGDTTEPTTDEANNHRHRGRAHHVHQRGLPAL